MIRITVHAGESINESDYRLSQSSDRWTVFGPEEALRRIGLEYKQADYFPTRQVVIVLDPVETPGERAEIEAKVREAAAALEGTGLL